MHHLLTSHLACKIDVSLEMGMEMEEAAWQVTQKVAFYP